MVCLSEKNTEGLSKASANLKAALNSAIFSPGKPCPDPVPPVIPGPTPYIPPPPPGPPRLSPPQRKHKAYTMTEMRRRLDKDKIDLFISVAERINRLKNTVSEDTLKSLPDDKDKQVGRWILDSKKKGFNRDEWLTSKDAENLKTKYEDYIKSVKESNEVKKKIDDLKNLKKEEKEKLYKNTQNIYDKEEKAYTTFIEALIKAYKGTGISNSEQNVKFQEEQWKKGSSPMPLEKSIETRNNNKDNVNKLIALTNELIRLINDEKDRTKYFKWASGQLTKGIKDVEDSKKIIPSGNTYKKYIDQANNTIKLAKTTLETIQTKPGAPPAAPVPKTRRNRRRNRKTRRN